MEAVTKCANLFYNKQIYNLTNLKQFKLKKKNNNSLNGIKPLNVLLAALVYDLYYFTKVNCVEKVVTIKFRDSVN